MAGGSVGSLPAKCPYSVGVCYNNKAIVSLAWVHPLGLCGIQQTDGKHATFLDSGCLTLWKCQDMTFEKGVSSMKSDMDVLRDLEEEIGEHIPLATLSDRIPLRPWKSSKRSKTVDQQKEEAGFNDFVSWRYFGAFVDERSNIVGLSLADCGLHDFPRAAFGLRHLRFVNLGENELADIPDQIGSWKDLQSLQLWGNQVRVIPHFVFEMELPVLIEGLLSTTSGILLGNNPIESPPKEILSHGIDAVRSYLSSVAEDVLQLNESKVILVGDGGSGKTSLVKRLLGRKFDPNEPQTHGINIDSWSQTLEKTRIHLNLWDFGGQEIMHATHQFFLSERSLYVLVLDGRKEEDPEYWLKHVQSFGGDSPILVVLNKMDENPGYDINRRFLQRKYPSIVGFYSLSCKTGKGIRTFQGAFKHALARVQITGTTWPVSWFRVKRRLQNTKQPFISYDDYCGICAGEQITDVDHQTTLVRFLHDLGVVVNFADIRLHDTHVLDPRWLTGAVYRIINSPELAKSHGVLNLSSLERILGAVEDGRRYPPDKYSYIIDIMRKFDLCYYIDRDTILVPDLLQVQEPEIAFDYDSAMAIRVEYDFLPKSIMPRFIVRKHRDIVRGLVWRTGVVLRDETFRTTAVVRADEAAKRVYIFVAGDHPRDYLTVIRSTLLDINASFEKLEFAEKIPLPDRPVAAVSYHHLLRLEKEGIADYYPDGADHSYDVQELLGTISTGRERSEEEFVRILRKTLTESDTEESAVQKANNVMMLQPNFMGLGINLNELVKRVLPRRKLSHN